MEQQSGAPPAVLGKSAKAILVITFAIAAFLPAFMSQGLNIALPIIGQEYGADAITLNWMVMAFVMANAALSLPIGKISDVAGIRKVFLYGLIFYTLSSLAIIFAVSPLMIIICRLAQGIGASMILVNILALISVMFPAEERGLAMGINVASVYVGASIGPFLGGMLTEAFGWKSIFLVSVLVGISVILLTLWKVKGEKTEVRKQKIDYTGSLIYVLSFMLLIYGFSQLPEALGGGLILLGLAGMFLFLKWEKRVENPLFDIEVFRRNRLFIFSNMAAFINFTAVFAVSFLLSLYLQYIKGLTPTIAGLVMIANPVVQTIISPIAGKLSDRMEPRVVSSIGMGLTALALIAFSFLSNETPVPVVIIELVVLGAGFALFVSPNSNAIMSSVNKQYYGVASATMSTMISSGQTLSMGIVMIVMALVIGRVAVTPEFYPAFLTSIRIAFAIFAGLCCCGVLVSLSRGKMR